MSNIIQVENLSKKYIIGHQQLKGKKTFREVINQSISTFGSKFIHPFSKNISSNSPYEEFWALKNICFEVEQGDRIGIIGRNGAGKSTLLKVLSRITEPTRGKITIKGRVASLLEVGTGFSGELTGRENIFLNGAILGMHRAEIKQKFDEIVDFSGVEKFLDTPVKRYSSGMYVRLAFAVAAHLEPEILIVDEVLAVGDAEFQKKCLGKMQDVSQKGGRTVIFVSHNMTAVKNLCKTGFFLEKGSVKHSGEINYIVNKYLAEASIQGICNNYWNFDDAPGTEKIKIKSAYVQFKEDKITVNTPFEIVTEFWCLEDMDLNINLFLYDINQTCIFSLPSDIEQVVKGKTYKLTFKIPENLMNDGIIKIDFMYVKKQEAIFVHKDALTFEVFENREANGYYGKWIGAVRPTQISRELEEIN